MRTRRAQLSQAFEIPWYRVIEAAVVGARCQPEVGGEVSATGEWSREEQLWVFRDGAGIGVTRSSPTAEQAERYGAEMALD
jgi:hypothetical protein